MSERRTGVALGWRWFARPAATGRGLRRRRMLAAACATWVALLGVTLWQANEGRLDRGRAQEPRPAAGVHRFDVLETDTPYRSDVWTTIYMGCLRAGTSQSPAPPGLPMFLEPGETYVSPAVERAIGTDPLAARRVPGHVVGTIGEAGLQSPDQYLVYAGAEPGVSWRSASGWGSPVVAVARGSVPAGALLGLVGVLIGLPALLLTRATGRMTAIARQRSLAACHLLGVPVRLLETAAAVDALLCAFVGAVGGAGVAAATVLAVHGTTMFGIEWFAPPTVLSPAATVATGIALSALVALDAATATRRDLRKPLVARAGGPRPVPRWTLAPLLMGTAGLAGIVAADTVLRKRIDPGWAITYFFVGGTMAALGAVAGMPLILHAWSTRLRRRPHVSTAQFVAFRRLSWKRDAIASACIGLALVGIASLVGAGTLADLDAISTTGPAGDRYDLQGVDHSHLPAALAVATPLRMLQVSHGRQTIDVAECATLAAFVDLTSPDAGAQFSAQCGAGDTFVIGSHAAAGSVVLPRGAGGFLRRATVIAVNPVEYARTHSKPAGQTDVIALPGRDEADVDDYVSRIMAVAPEVQVTDLSADSYAPVVAPTRRLLVACTALGTLTASALLILGALDQRRRSRIDGARLVVLGASRRLTARIHAVAYGHGVTAALAVGLIIGLLAAMVYDQVGGLVASPGSLGVTLAGLAVIIAVVAVFVTWATALPEHRAALTEEIQRE